MIQETIAAVQGIKAATDILRGMKSLDDRTKVNEAIIEVQSHLLGAQGAMFELQDVVQALKTRIKSLEALDPKQFELLEPVIEGRSWNGRRAYRDKGTGTYYCPGCYSQGQLVPVQFWENLAKPCGLCGTGLGYASGQAPQRSASVLM